MESMVAGASRYLLFRLQSKELRLLILMDLDSSFSIDRLCVFWKLLEFLLNRKNQNFFFCLLKDLL